MALTVVWNEYNGTDTWGTPTHVNITAITTGSLDDADFVVADYPITAGDNSYEKYITITFTGQFSLISNGKIYKSAGNYVTGETLTFDGTSVVKSTPDQADEGYSDIPTSLPGSANFDLGVSGYLSGSGVSPTEQKQSVFCAFQAKTTGSTPSGALNSKTITLQYDVT
jgi:hypothetical protein